MNEEFDLDVSRRTVSGWISKYDGEGEWFSDSPRAYREGYDARAEDCFRIAEDETIDTQRARLRIDTNLRVLGKFAPKKYGDKIDVNAKVDISFGDMISEITDLGKDDQHKH